MLRYTTPCITSPNSSAAGSAESNSCHNHRSRLPFCGRILSSTVVLACEPKTAQKTSRTVWRRLVTTYQRQGEGRVQERLQWSAMNAHHHQQQQQQPHCRSVHRLTRRRRPWFTPTRPDQSVCLYLTSATQAAAAADRQLSVNGCPSGTCTGGAPAAHATLDLTT